MSHRSCEGFPARVSQLLLWVALLFAAPAAPEEPAPRLELELSRTSLEQMATAGADWILRMQERSGVDRGRFRYRVDPAAGRPKEEPGEDNFLRQAGTTYSLILVHEATGRRKYLKGAERGVGYLLSRLTRDPALPGCAYFEFNGKVKLGGVALPLLSLLELQQVRRSARHDQVVSELIRFLVFMQQEDGELRSIYLYGGSKEHAKVDWDSAIYPGEAMLALTRRYAATRDEQLLAVLDRAFRYYRSRRQLYERQAFIPWTTTAMVELYDLTGQERFADWAVEMTDFMVGTQVLAPERSDFGSFRPKPGANTGSYLEGILDGYRLVVRKGDEPRRLRYRLSALAGLRFLSGLQYDAAAASRHPGFERLLLGGFRAGPGDDEVRIDHTQHAISAYVKGMECLY